VGAARHACRPKGPQQGFKGINIKISLGIKILFRSEIKINTYKNPDDLRLRRETKINT